MSVGDRLTPPTVVQIMYKLMGTYGAGVLVDPDASVRVAREASGGLRAVNRRAVCVDSCCGDRVTGEAEAHAYSDRRHERADQPAREREQRRDGHVEDERGEHNAAQREPVPRTQRKHNEHETLERDEHLESVKRRTRS